MSTDLAYAAAFIEARLDEDEALVNKVYGSWRVSDDGNIVDTSYASYIAVGPQGKGIDGDSRDYIIRYGPERALRDIRAKRAILAACTRAAEAGLDTPAAALAIAVLDAMSTEWEHPDRPFVPDWTIHPGVLLRKALEAQGKSPDAIPGARLIIEGTRRVNPRNAKWIADVLGTSAEMWLNAQRLHDAAILRGAKDTSDDHTEDPA